MKIKGWKRFQHFKDRKPPWIKLYKDLLEDPEWHELAGDDAKALIALWLVASDDATGEGMLPCLRKIAFRLRSSEKRIIETISRLSHWLIQDDIKEISERYQDGPPETETETETETEAQSANLFSLFWENYPKRKDKLKAEKAFKKIKADDQTMASILLALETQKESNDWLKDDGQFIPLPATWLNGRRWEDEISNKKSEWEGER